MDGLEEILCAAVVRLVLSPIELLAITVRVSEPQAGLGRIVALSAWFLLSVGVSFDERGAQTN